MDPLNDIVDGPFGSSLKRSDYVTSGMPVLKIQNIKPFAIEEKRMDYVSPAKFQSLSRHGFVSGDILMTKLGDPLGVSAVVETPGEGLIVADLVRIRVQRIDTRFLCYQLNSPPVREFINSQQKGTTRPRITLSVVRELPIRVPRLHEQHRLVAILDEAFAGIAAAKDNAEEALRNARILFESHLTSVFEQRGDGLVEKPLMEWVDSISTGPFGSLLHKSDYQDGGIPLINPINIVGDTIVPDERKTVGPAAATRLTRYVLEHKDVVIARRGEIGRCAVVSEDQAGWLCGTGCFFIRPSSKVDPYYLTHLLRSNPYRSKLEGVSDRATMPSISNTDLSRLIVALPSLSQQHHTLETLDGFSAETEQLEAVYRRKLAALDELKQSLLHHAFTGQL